MAGHRFGGSWTQEKLDRLQKYLFAYMQIMKSRDFRVAYIDAFAGTGYRQPQEEKDVFLSDLFSEREPSAFLKGSAAIALEIEPPFHRYIFIEKKASHINQLEKLKEDYPERAKNIVIMRGDANSVLQDLCDKNWRAHRAVLFLDPYGMQVTWDTLKAVAFTKAIDLWILFPSAVGVNRLVRRDGKIDEGWRKRLDLMFGTTTWFDKFYSTTAETDLFETRDITKKVANIEAIGRYFIERLKTIFPSVADNPLSLSTPEGRPLYLLCFASANKTGVKIAQDILRK